MIQTSTLPGLGQSPWLTHIPPDIPEAQVTKHHGLEGSANTNAESTGRLANCRMKAGLVKPVRPGGDFLDTLETPPLLRLRKA